MKCIVEFEEPPFRFDFCQNKNKHKIWLDVLLKYCALDLVGFASALDVSVAKLLTVLKGLDFLDEAPATTLAQLFLMFFSD